MHVELHPASGEQGLGKSYVFKGSFGGYWSDKPMQIFRIFAGLSFFLLGRNVSFGLYCLQSMPVLLAVEYNNGCSH